jgi:hypothetical protein
MVSIPRFKLVGFAAAAALAIIVCLAPAASQASSLGQVRSELREARAALDRIWNDSGGDFGDDPADEADDPGAEVDPPDDGDDPGDDPIDPGDDLADVNLDAVQDNLAHTAKARELAGKLKPKDRRAGALVAVNDQADENVFEYADDIGWVDEDEQPAFVDALQASLALRSGVISTLVGQGAKLSESVRAKALESVSAALSDGDPEVLLDTLAEEQGWGATEPVKQTVVGPLADLLDGTDAVISNLRDLGARLPSSERGDVRDAADQIDESLTGLPEYVDGLFDEMQDYDDPASGIGAFCGYVSALPLPTPTACG